MSSGIEGRIDGAAELMNSLGALGSLARDAIKDALYDAVMAVHKTAVESIREHGSVSKVVTRYNPKREVEVSAPGEPPNSDRGTLVQSIQFDVNEDTLVGTVGTNLDYGLYLELGTTHMSARPWLMPAFEEHREEIIQKLGDAVSVAVRSRSA